ncbi:uncharacterized protein [Euphorbia lathyris]|uniref:uncharacterized protein isoform X2 n=1 Tax=Euphorbia lathyris TaxID=212925 RepID=UPI0033130F3A
MERESRPSPWVSPLPQYLVDLEENRNIRPRPEIAVFMKVSLKFVYLAVGAEAKPTWKSASVEKYQLGFLLSSLAFNLTDLLVFTPMTIELDKSIFWFETLCMAFTVSGKLKPEEALQATLSFLTHEVVATVGVTSLPSEESSERRRKLEYVDMQEELIKVHHWVKAPVPRCQRMRMIRKIVMPTCMMEVWTS